MHKLCNLCTGQNEENDSDDSLNIGMIFQIESSAVNLWNMAVARRTGGTISSMLNARGKLVMTYH